MALDPKRELLRHAVATIVFRGRIAVEHAPSDFAEFRVTTETRSPVEILAHIGDLLEGSHYLLKGEFIELASEPSSWESETERFFNTARDLDTFLASDGPLSHSPEKMIQGPIGDALTHVGQIVLLRRIAGVPVRQEPYFTADISPGIFE